MIGVVGDAFIDEWHFGTVRRISPEADCPVFDRETVEEHPGGAAHVMHVIDRLGGKVVAWYGTMGRKIRFVGRQQLLREDVEQKDWMHTEREAFEHFKTLGATSLVLSDYDKGTFKGDLAQRLIALGIPTIVDPKGPWERYRGASVITPNSKELGDDDPQWLIETYRFGAILETRGGEGMRLHLPKKLWIEIPPHKVNAIDVTGAGDVVVATLAVRLAECWDVLGAALDANEMAAKSTEKWGTR